MKIEETKEATLQEKLKSEVRTCPQCTLEVPNPFVERCPRCFAVLPTIQLDCQGCVHRLACPVAK